MQLMMLLCVTEFMGIATFFTLLPESGVNASQSKHIIATDM